jgi:hypothetical protein
MTRPRLSRSEFDELLAHLSQLDELALDDGTANRLLAGFMHVDDAPQAHQGTALAVAALTAPPRPHELAEQRQAVARLAAEVADNAKRNERRKRALRKSRRVMQLAATSMIGGAVLLGGLAAAGALPVR